MVPDPGRPSSGGRLHLEVVRGELDIPTVETIAAPVGDDVAGLESLVGFVGDAATVAAAVDAGDGLGGGHEPTVSRTVPESRQTVSMRVVAGSARGRRLTVPEGGRTRPTADRVREAMFNSLFSLGAIEDARVVDVFAGSGALGIEALSRGAARCTFVESDRRALEALRENIETLGFGDQSTVVAGDGPTAVRQVTDVDLVLLDPPYDFDDWDALLSSIHDAVVVIESDREVGLPEGWETHRARRYGTTVVMLATAGSASHPRQWRLPT